VRIKSFSGKALIAENGYSIFKINNTVWEAFKLTLWELIKGALIAPNFLDVE